MNNIVIVGSGLAGYTVARELRKLDRTTRVTVITRDNGAFYSKPMLSNALAAGKAPAELATATAEQMEQQLDIDVWTETCVSAVLAAGSGLMCGGRAVPYSRLVLALGADPIRVSLDGDGADAVRSVNDLDDYAQFRSGLERGKRVAIIGGGLIGCEFANDLAGAGYDVSVIDPGAWPLGRLVPERVGGALAEALADLGVRWHLGTVAVGVDRHDGALRLRLADGSELIADNVLSAVGLSPRTRLARSAGIEVNRGIVTDRWLRTSAPNVYALGDCAEVGGHYLPFVLPIMHAARALVKTLTGVPTPVVYPAMPVAVKTPILPVTVAPPAPGTAGQWQIQGSGRDVEALFVDVAGNLAGFALSGAAVARKQELAKRLPAVIADPALAIS